MKKLMVGIVVVILIMVAVIGVVSVSNPAAAQDVTGNVTVYVEDATTGQMMGATVKLGQQTFEESMMMAFGIGIRKTDFQPLAFSATITGINPTAAYNVWVAASIKVAGVGLTSLTSSTVTFNGRSGASGTPACLYSEYVVNNEVVASNKLVAGATTTVDMFADAGKKFNHIFVSPVIVPGTGVSRDLVGSDLNGMWIAVTVQATGDNGVTSTVEQGLSITATYASPALTITVTNITVTGPTSTMISPFQLEDLAVIVRT